MVYISYFALRFCIHYTQSNLYELEFMSEWDGLASNNQGIMILGATNRPFDLDDAILRRMPRRVLVDLPTAQQRKQIFSVHLNGESLDKDVSLEELSKKTEHYSGSDIKNVCVAAALGRVKESILRESMDPVSQGSSDKDMILDKLSALEDWNSVLGSGPSTKKDVTLPPLTSSHFDLAFKEVPPSLTDEMQTLVELRKWNAVYGENGGSKKKGPAWGFNLETTSEVSFDTSKAGSKE
jgi:SpoVK/Ycf46/Vps4 family AAA+-type ATPase